MRRLTETVVKITESHFAEHIAAWTSAKGSG
jgi:hypothetical protein